MDALILSDGLQLGMCTHIVATVLQHHFMLLTGNVKETRIKSVRIELMAVGLYGEYNYSI